MWAAYVNKQADISMAEVAKCSRRATSFAGFCEEVGKSSKVSNIAIKLMETLEQFEDARRHFNELREMLGLKTFRLRQKSGIAQVPTPPAKPPLPSMPTP